MIISDGAETYAGTITSVLSFNSFLIADIAIKLAEDPEFAKKQAFPPISSFKRLSRSVVIPVYRALLEHSRM